MGEQVFDWGRSLDERLKRNASAPRTDVQGKGKAVTRTPVAASNPSTGEPGGHQGRIWPFAPDAKT